MKITVRGRPEFTLELTLPLTVALIRCASTHYDRACQQLCSSTASPLHRARFLLDYPEAQESYAISLSFREADLLMKATEPYRMYGILGKDQLALVKDFRSALHVCLMEANDHFEDWTFEHDSNPPPGPWPWPTAQSVLFARFSRAWVPGFIKILVEPTKVDKLLRGDDGVSSWEDPPEFPDPFGKE